MLLIGSESANPLTTRANLSVLRHNLDRFETDMLRTGPLAAPERRLNSGGRRHLHLAARRSAPALAQSGPHAGSYAPLADVDRLHAARRFAVLHAHALAAGLASDAAATAAIAWMAGGPMGAAWGHLRARRSALHADG